MVKELDARIKVWADKIYASDKVKFKRLVVWIKAAERTSETIVIARALEQFCSHADRMSAGLWWSYLDKLLEKEEGKQNARNEEAQSERHKKETGEPAEVLLAGIRRRAENPRAAPDKVSK